MADIPTVTLKNGIKVPMVGLGTWRSPPELTTQAIKDAIDVGYRHFDCAYIYGNEREVGLALNEKMNSGDVKRSELFITSKLWNTFHRPDLVRGACETTLKNLDLKYLDNYLLHWPIGLKEEADTYPKDENGKLIFSTVDYVDTWHAMEALVDAGLVRNIGLSNFNKNQIARILSNARKKPTILQIECHPYLNQNNVMEFCGRHGIVVTAYSPLGSAHTPYDKPGEYRLLEHPKILQIACKHCKTPAQVLIRYQVQRGNIVIPRSINKAHMESNLKICDFQLTSYDIADIDGLDINGRIMTMEAAAGHPYHPFENDVY